MTPRAFSFAPPKTTLRPDREFGPNRDPDAVCDAQRSMLRGSTLGGQLSRSMISAMPCPPPTHMVSRPNCLS